MFLKSKKKKICKSHIENAEKRQETISSVVEEFNHLSSAPLILCDPVHQSPDPAKDDPDTIQALQWEIRELANDLNSKLDKAILNKESLLSRIAGVETKQRETGNR